jgi:Domain of unknown function (DUF202)
MIRSYTDHAANERTFLAWLRTGIAITLVEDQQDAHDNQQQGQDHRQAEVGHDA